MCHTFQEKLMFTYKTKQQQWVQKYFKMRRDHVWIRIRHNARCHTRASAGLRKYNKVKNKKTTTKYIPFFKQTNAHSQPGLSCKRCGNMKQNEQTLLPGLCLFLEIPFSCLRRSSVSLQTQATFKMILRNNFMLEKVNKSSKVIFNIKHVQYLLEFRFPPSLIALWFVLSSQLYIFF